MKRIRTVAILLAVAMLSGCISVKSYVDPAFGRATYDDIQRVSQPHDLRVEVEFQRNGEIFERAHSEVENHVLRSLRATGAVNPVAEGSGSVRVVVNNIANIGESAAKGFGTGLTFGLAGSAVTDYYEISIDYTDAYGNVMTHDYKHALHTTVGNKAAPVEDVEPTSLADGFGTIVEEIILSFVKDMQDNGLLMGPSNNTDPLSTFSRPDVGWSTYGDVATTTTRRGAGQPSTVQPGLSGSSASASDS